MKTLHQFLVSQFGLVYEDLSKREDGEVLLVFLTAICFQVLISSFYFLLGGSTVIRAKSWLIIRKELCL